MREIDGPDEMRSLVGSEVGVSDWMEVTQERINLFADATEDHQWIHVDPERAASGPFGKTIAHGFLTLSLLPPLITDIFTVKGRKMGVNYGFDKVRFPAPVPVNSKIRARVAVQQVEDVPGGIQVCFQITIEVEGSDKPACVAEWIIRNYF